MADLILGIAASHTTLMNTQWEKVEKLARAHDFRNALYSARDRLAAARPDAVVIIGSNHFRGFWLDLMPSFTIGVESVVSAGEHGTPTGELPIRQDLAHGILESLLDQKFDVAFSTKLSVDHGISHAFQWLIGEHRTPIIPLVINCFAPPLPSLDRCAKLGSALRRAIDCLPSSERVAVIATGGLSHALPFPDWRSPEGDDEEFLAESWRIGRGNWEQFESRRRNIVVSYPPRINEAFDRWFLEELSSNGLSNIPGKLDQRELITRAGNGGNEIRAWLAMAAALGNEPGRTLAYSPMPEWLTGMAVALIEPGNFKVAKEKP